MLNVGVGVWVLFKHGVGNVGVAMCLSTGYAYTQILCTSMHPYTHPTSTSTSTPIRNKHIYTPLDKMTHFSLRYNKHGLSYFEV